MQVSLNDPVETIMLSYQEARPLLCDFQLKSVIMRFLKDDSVPVIDNSGTCVGIVHCKDCVEVNLTLMFGISFQSCNILQLLYNGDFQALLVLPTFIVMRLAVAYKLICRKPEMFASDGCSTTRYNETASS
jgi:hypothetical protein